MYLLQGTCPSNAPLSKYQNKYKNTTMQKYRKQNKNAKLHATHCKARDCMQYIFCKLYKYKIVCSIFFENFTNTKLCAVSFFFFKIQNYKIACNIFFANFTNTDTKLCATAYLQNLQSCTKSFVQQLTWTRGLQLSLQTPTQQNRNVFGAQKVAQNIGFCFTPVLHLLGL